MYISIMYVFFVDGDVAQFVDKADSCLLCCGCWKVHASARCSSCIVFNKKTAVVYCIRRVLLCTWHTCNEDSDKMMERRECHSQPPYQP